MATIKNVVATAELGCELDLEYLNTCDIMVHYDARKFSGLLIRKLKPVKCHCQVYRNGKMTVNGGKSTKQAKMLANMFCNSIKKQGFKNARISNFKVVNIIASLDLGFKVKMENLHKIFDNMIFEPELFPGASIRLKETSSTCVIFHTSKCNFLGGKTELDIHAAALEIILSLSPPPPSSHAVAESLPLQSSSVSQVMLLEAPDSMLLSSSSVTP